MRLNTGVLIVTLSMLVCPQIAVAQRPLQIPVEFDFISPGARSLALGGAFTGLADDATAASTNPAGLRILTRREMSVEGRFGRTETPFLQGGRVQGAVTNQGIDRIAGPVFGETTDSTGGLSFVSFVTPIKNGTLAVYRHELSRFNLSVQTDGPFSSFGREQPLQQEKELRIINYGASGAYRLNDRVSIGGGFVISDFRLTGTTALFAPEPQRFFDTPVFRPDLQTFVATQDGDDIGFGFSAGTLITVTRRVQIGGVVRRSPQATFVQFEQALPNGEIFFDDVEGKFKVPNVVSIGASYRPSDVAVITAEYSFVQYSSLLRDFVRLQSGPENRPGRPNFFTHFDIEDGNEVRVGGEYVFAGVRLQPAVRGGLWFDPDHSIHYIPFNDNSADDALFSLAFGLGEDEIHYTAGIGLALSTKIEVNAGADFSSRRNTASVSSIFRF